MIPFPFAYKLTANTEINPGTLLDVPAFCQRNRQNPKCKQFYLNLKTNQGVAKCPYGFCAEKCAIGDTDIIFTCLNVAQFSDRKEVQKRVRDSEFFPRLPIDRYESAKLAFIQSYSANHESLEFDKKEAEIANEKEALANVMHELGNMTNQLISRADKLSTACQQSYKDFAYIESLSTNIYSLTNLMNVRISSYNLEVDPTKSDPSEKIEMCIYRKVEKAYKCLQQSICDKHLKVTLKGNSYNLFPANSILEIGIFIILENAIKYAPYGSDITVDFKENDDKLSVTFTNWGFRTNNGELPELTKRGYRGKNVLSYNNINGRGIGLYLLSIICNMQNIKLERESGKDTRNFNGDGYVYSPFIVKLGFEGMKVVVSHY